MENNFQILESELKKFSVLVVSVIEAKKSENEITIIYNPAEYAIFRSRSVN